MLIEEGLDRGAVFGSDAGQQDVLLGGQPDGQSEFSDHLAQAGAEVLAAAISDASVLDVESEIPATVALFVPAEVVVDGKGGHRADRGERKADTLLQLLTKPLDAAFLQHILQPRMLPIFTIAEITVDGDDAGDRFHDLVGGEEGDLVGQPLVINIWGSTCGPCKKELPDFAAAHAVFGDQVRFVGIDYLPPSDREEQFARDKGVQYELLYDASGDFINEMGISAFPVTLIVTPDGTIVQQTGQLDEAKLTALIEEHLL